MKYDIKTIEESGVDFVKQRLRKLNTLDPNIPSNDKGVSWDGHILVYQSVPWVKKDLIAKIPTQVKTRTRIRYGKTFRISLDDLKNYKKEGSILYFWVQIVKGQYKIFYAALFLLDLEQLISTNANEKSVPVKFEIFPEDISEIRVLIDEFVKTANKQKQVLPNVYDLDTFIKKHPNRPISFDLRLPKNPTPRDIVSSIKSQKPYVYYQYDEDIFVPVGKFEPTELSLVTEGYVEVRVSNEVLFTKVSQENFVNRVRLKIGNTILLDFLGDRFNFNYDITSADLIETIKTLQFVIALMTNEPIYWNNKRMFSGIPKSGDIDLMAIKKQLELYLDIQKLFVRLGIRKSLFLQSLPKNEVNNLMTLCQSELYDREVPLTGKVPNYGMVDIGDIHILCCCTPATRQGNYIIKSIFDKGTSSFALQDENGNSIPVSNYLLLSQGGVLGFRTVDNINYDDLIDSLNVEASYSIVRDAYNSLLLSMLSYYDEIKYDKTFSACLWLANYLWNHSGREIDFINVCQVKYRNGTLTENDKEKLTQIKNTSDDIVIKLACSILLHSFEECHVYYSQLPKWRQEIFNEYPIRNLWMENKN